MNIIFLLGALQGFIVAAVLFYQSIQYNRWPLRWLSILVLLIGGHLLYGYIMLTGLVLHFSWLIRLYEPVPFLYAYLIYHFTFSLTGSKPNRWVGTGMLLLFAGSLMYLLPFYTSSVQHKISFHEQVKCFNYPEDFKDLFLLKSLAGISSLTLSIQHLRSYNKALLQQFSSLQGKSLLWLQWLYMLMLAIWLIATSRFFMGFHINTSYAGAIAVTVFIYFISFYAGRQQSIELLPLKPVLFTKMPLTEQKRLLPAEEGSDPIPSVQKAIEEAEENNSKYKNSTLTKEEAEKIYTQLVAVINDKRLYADKECNLQMVTVATGIKPFVISETLNSYYQTNFYNFINRLRVEDAKNKLKVPGYDAYTLEGIGELCGFKSKSTFYSSFKKITGLTPSEYKKL